MGTSAIRSLLTGLIDYAGLYPPASVSMAEAVENYARYRMTDDAWMLGKFVCPASRLAEFDAAAGPLLPGTFATSGYREHAGGDPWRLTVVADLPLDETIESMLAFDERHRDADRGKAAAVALEVKAPSAAFIDEAIDKIPEEIYPFFEIDASTDPRGLIAAMADLGCAAKLRTGGVVESAIPSARTVAAFLHACAAARVPFKATAGLHHALRGEYPLTYEPGCASGRMHGFLNVFLGAVLARAAAMPPSDTERLLGETGRAAILLTDAAIGWGRFRADAMAVAMARESFALSYGSCSFEEPAAELRALGLIEGGPAGG